MDDIEYTPFSKWVVVNPPVQVRHLSQELLVSFIPMSDVTETGQWVHQQERRLGKVLGYGYTPFQEGDILFAKITPCMENGKGAHAVNLANGVGFGTTEFHVLRVKPDVNARFIYHWTQSNQLRLRAEALMIGSAGQRRVSSDFFDVYYVPDIPLLEQCHIATILDTIDSQIQQTEQLIAKLSQQREGLLQALLTRGLDEHEELRDPDAHPELFKDSVLGRIPREWEIKHLKDLTRYPITDFGSFSMTNLLDFRDSGIPFLKTEAIHDYGIDQSQLTFISEEVHKQLPQSVVHEGDLLLTKIGAIGRVCVYDGSLGECNSNAASAKIRLDTSKVNSHYVAHYLRSNMLKQQYLKEIISTPPRINLGQVNAWYIPIPSLREQLSIVAVLEILRADTSSESSHLAKLKDYKQGLMHDLLTGRVRVGANVEA